MTVTVHMHLINPVAEPDGRDRMVMEVGTGTTIETFLASLGAERDTWLVAVNGKAVEKDRVLAPSDQLDCFEPVAGG